MSAPKTNLITSSSLIGIVPQFTANVTDNHFAAANNYANDLLRKLIPSELFTRLSEVYNLSEWSSSTAYTTGQERVYNQRGYVALQNGTNKNPETETTYWEEIEIYSVYRDYIKPYLCWQAYNNFLIYHGVLVSQGGIKKHIDINAEEVSQEEKSRAIKRAQDMADNLFMEFKSYMDDNSNTIDTVVYSFNDNPTFKPKFGIHIVKMIILLVCFTKAYGQYPTPIVNEAKNYHFTKTVYIDGKLKVGYPTPTIARDIHFVADTIRFEGLDGTGSYLGIDVNGDVVRTTIGGGGVTGLNQYELLFGSSTGTIDQDPDFKLTTEFYSGYLSHLDGGLKIGGTSGNYSEFDNQGVLTTYYSSAINNGDILYGNSSGMYVLPLGTANQVLSVKSDGSNLEWATGSAGTVTSFSATDGNGFDFTVTNPTTTPTLSLTTTVTDNQVMVSNSGAISGSSLFTYDNTANNEHFDVTVLEFDVVGTSAYPYSLFNVTDNGNVSICDFNLNANGTYAIFDDPSEAITLSANNGITINQFSGAGDNLVYSTNAGVLSTTTLTSNDFNFTSGTLSIDYTNGQEATTSQDGFLSQTDWDTFNNKVSFDITGQSSETTIAHDDEIPIYDVSESAINKITAEDALAGFNRPDALRNYKFTYFNEFLNTVGTATGGNDLIATNSGTGAGTNNQATDASNRVGLVRSTTGSTATGRTSPSTSSTACAFGGGTWVYEIEIKLAALSTVTQRYQLVIGFLDVQNAANQTDAIAFVYDEGGVSTGSAASANWQTLTSSNSTRTWTTTGTAVATGWTNLRIEVNAGASSVTYYVNGVAMGTSHTTNIPSGTARATGFGYLMIKSIGTTASTMDVDYIFCESDFTTNR